MIDNLVGNIPLQYIMNKIIFVVHANDCHLATDLQNHTIVQTMLVYIVHVEVQL